MWVCVDGVGCDDTEGVPYSYGGHFEHISCRCSCDGDACDLLNRLGGGRVSLEGGNKCSCGELWRVVQLEDEVVQCCWCLLEDLFYIVCYAEGAIESVALLALLLVPCAYPQCSSC